MQWRSVSVAAKGKPAAAAAATRGALQLDNKRSSLGATGFDGGAAPRGLFSSRSQYRIRSGFCNIQKHNSSSGSGVCVVGGGREIRTG
jgi:hypothetical protein